MDASLIFFNRFEALKRSRHLSTGTASTSTAVAEPSATSPELCPTRGHGLLSLALGGDADDGRCRAPGRVTEDRNRRAGAGAHEDLSSILETAGGSPKAPLAPWNWERHAFRVLLQAVRQQTATAVHSAQFCGCRR